MPIDKLKRQLSNKFVRNVGWLGGAELVNRIFRLATTVTLARSFSTYEYGLMAVIYTTFDMATVFSQSSGFTAKIIQADEQELKVICNTSFWLNLVVCSLLFIGQCLAAFPIAKYYVQSNDIILPLCTVALIYLSFPFFVITNALIERENRLEVKALGQTIQAITSNIMIVVLALLGWGIWAVVLPIVLTTPIWIVVTWRNHSWRPPRSLHLERWQEIAGFGGNLIGVELLSRLRGYIDYIIVGQFLGIEALGIYYFAFNAGFGISLNVIKSLKAALLPYLCEVRVNIPQLMERYYGSLKKLAVILLPFVILQSSLAPVYVPIVFGDKWTAAIPILVIICLSAVPFALATFTDNLLISVGQPKITLYCNLIYTCLFTVFLLGAVNWGIFWVAVAVLACQLLISPIYGVWAIKYVFAKR